MSETKSGERNVDSKKGRFYGSTVSSSGQGIWDRKGQIGWGRTAELMEGRAAVQMDLNKLEERIDKSHSTSTKTNASLASVME